MANYSSVQDIFSTISNATVIRNNSKNDDGVDTVTGVGWFSYNGVACSNLYVSGNMFIGLGANSEHLKVNRGDGACYYIWREEGTLDNFFNFLRIRWQGYTRYNYSSASYLQTFDVILWDTGDISLHMVDIPTSNFDGTFTLGNLTYTKPTTSSPDITFRLQDDGSYLAEYAIIDISRKPCLTEGSCEFVVDGFDKITQFLTGYIKVDADIPDSTELKIFAKINDNDYVAYENGSEISFINSGYDLSQSSLHIRLDFSTTDEFLSPSVKGLEVIVRDFADENIVLLTLGSGNRNSMQNAAGDITVKYDGSGSLMGLGGPVAAFEVTFTPEDLIPKVNPMDAEHIELTNITPIGSLKKVYYTNSKSSNEHIELVNIVPVGILTKIDDI